MAKKTTFFAKSIRWVRNLMLLFFAVTIGWTLLAGLVPVWITPLMVIRSIEAIADGKIPKNEKDWVPIEEISPNLVNAVIAAEDNLFMVHNGFSFDSMKKAWEYNKRGKKIRGGSTITQQTAKNVFLWNKRSYVRKGLEAYFTVLVELFWSKKRIMEVYLNVIEMGDGIYGAQAASRHYFEKDASKLTRRQAAAIAVCLPNPRRFSPANPSGYIQRRTSSIVSLMGKLPRVDFTSSYNTPKQ